MLSISRGLSYRAFTDLVDHMTLSGPRSIFRSNLMRRHPIAYLPTPEGATFPFLQAAYHSSFSQSSFDVHNANALGNNFGSVGSSQPLEHGGFCKARCFETLSARGRNLCHGQKNGLQHTDKEEKERH